MTEANPQGLDQPGGGAAAAGAEVAAASNSAAMSDEQKHAQIIAAERQYQQGVQAIRDNRLEDAVELFGQCLEMRVAIYGDQAAECGGAYYRYGAALFYKAQDEADVFGDNLQDAAEKHDAQDDDHAPEDQAGPSSGEKRSHDDEAGPSGLNSGAASDAAGGRTADEGDELEAEQTDMQLAWSMLEIAKLIFSRDRATNALDLADVHMLLGDLSSENDAFADALEDYRTALELLGGDLPEGQQPPVRRLAELHYKASLALQFLHKAGPAKEHTETAVRLVQGRLADLAARSAAGRGGAAPAPAVAAGSGADAPAPAGKATTTEAAVPAAAEPAADPGATLAATAEGGEEAAAAGPQPANATSPAAGAAAGGVVDPAVEAKAQAPGKSADAKEVQALKDSLESLQERLEELNALIDEEAATRQQLRAAFASIAGAGAASGIGSAAAAATPSTASGGSSAAFGSKPGSAPAAGAVRDLGVVGRGQKRITLAPVASGQPAAAAKEATAGGAGGAVETKRRRLDDLMGGGSESSGFGTPARAVKAQQPAGASIDPAAPASGAAGVTASVGIAAASGPRTQPSVSTAPAVNQTPAALPAFLRPAAVAAAYGDGKADGDARQPDA